MTARWPQRRFASPFIEPGFTLCLGSKQSLADWEQCGTYFIGGVPIFGDYHVFNVVRAPILVRVVELRATLTERLGRPIDTREAIREAMCGLKRVPFDGWGGLFDGCTLLKPRSFLAFSHTVRQ